MNHVRNRDYGLPNAGQYARRVFDVPTNNLAPSRTEVSNQNTMVALSEVSAAVARLEQARNHPGFGEDQQRQLASNRSFQTLLEGAMANTSTDEESLRYLDYIRMTSLQKAEELRAQPIPAWNLVAKHRANEQAAVAEGVADDAGRLVQIMKARMERVRDGSAYR